MLVFWSYLHLYRFWQNCPGCGYFGVIFRLCTRCRVHLWALAGDGFSDQVTEIKDQEIKDHIGRSWKLWAVAIFYHTLLYRFRPKISANLHTKYCLAKLFAVYATGPLQLKCKDYPVYYPQVSCNFPSHSYIWSVRCNKNQHVFFIISKLIGLFF